MAHKAEKQVAGKSGSKSDSKDYWDDSGQVFFTGGIGYGLTPELQAISLGSEANILEAFRTGKLPDSLTSVQRQVLQGILDYRKEIVSNATTVELRKPGAIRSRPSGAVKRRAANLRPAKARKRLPLRKA